MSSFKLADAIDLDSNPPSSMKIKEIRQELESMGIGTKSFIEKSEFVDALIEARKERKAPGGDENAPGSGDDEEGPLCFICLDGSNDTDGPLRRDCVCRGDDAGYAHLKCLVEYAKSQSMQLGINLNSVLDKAWTECRNCRHRFQKDLGLDMANECVTFIDTAHPESRYLRIQSLSNKLLALAEMSKAPVCLGDYTSLLSPELRNEGREIGRNLQSMLDLEPGLRRCFEESTLNSLGIIVFDGETKESAKEAIMHYEKLLELYKANDDSMGIHHCESSIHGVQLRSGVKDYCRSDRLKELIRSKVDYESCIAKHGLEHADTIFAGVGVASGLSDLYHSIEAERLIRMLISFSRRVLGPHHDTTKRAESVLENLVAPRIVFVEGNIAYRALRYKNNGMDIVIHGPFMEPESKQTQSTVSAASVSPLHGTPVMVVGHDIQAPHYYGKIGDLRGWNKANMVYFDDKLLQPYLVPPVYLRVVFDLPPEPEHPTMDFCFHCMKKKDGQKSMMVCGHCKYVQYCSKDCQRAHWRVHKGPCRYQQKQKEIMKQVLKQNNPNMIFSDE